MTGEGACADLARRIRTRATVGPGRHRARTSSSGTSAAICPRARVRQGGRLRRARRAPARGARRAGPRRGRGFVGDDADEARAIAAASTKRRRGRRWRSSPRATRSCSGRARGTRGRGSARSATRSRGKVEEAGGHAEQGWRDGRPTADPGEADREHRARARVEIDGGRAEAEAQLAPAEAARRDTSVPALENRKPQNAAVRGGASANVTTPRP